MSVENMLQLANEIAGDELIIKDKHPLKAGSVYHFSKKSDLIIATHYMGEGYNENGWNVDVYEAFFLKEGETISHLNGELLTIDLVFGLDVKKFQTIANYHNIPIPGYRDNYFTMVYQTFSPDILYACTDVKQEGESFRVLEYKSETFEKVLTPILHDHFSFYS